MKSLLAVLLLALCSACAGPAGGEGGSPDAATAPARAAGVSALGRLEPESGVLRIAAPSTPHAVSGSVVRTLAVEVGDDVAAGALLATTDSTDLLEAALREADAELGMRTSAARAAGSRAEEACVLADLAAREAERRARLVEQEVVSVDAGDAASSDATAKAAGCRSARDEARHAETAIDWARARRQRAAAEAERSRIRAPAAGRVLAIHARPGELVGAEGLLDLGRVARMFAIAEVFETDIGTVRVGQRATVTSEALARPLTGRVERIRPRVRKLDVVGTDPAAAKDARIVEVEVALDDPAAAAALTHLQVEVVLHPGP